MTTEQRINSVRSRMTDEVQEFGKEMQKPIRPITKVRIISRHINQMEQYQNELINLYDELDKKRIA